MNERTKKEEKNERNAIERKTQLIDSISAVKAELQFHLGNWMEKLKHAWSDNRY